MLKTGATLVTTPQDVVEALAPLSGLSRDAVFREAAETAPYGPPQVTPPPILDDRDRALVLDALGPAPVDVDSLMRATGLGVRAINVVLMELDLAGRVVRHGRQLVSRAE